LADKPTSLILAALGRAAASPAGAPRFAGRGAAGLFPSTAAGRQAAQRCKDEGWLRSASAECNTAASAGDTALLVKKKAKSAAEMCALTEKGKA